MSGINISLVANVRDFIKGTKDSADALDKVVDSLEEVAREAGTTENKADTAMREMAKDGEKASDKLDKSFRDAFDTARKESKDAMDDVSRNSKRSMKEASDHVGAFKDEAKQNFAETAASFDGTADGIINGAQGLSAGLAMSMGPTGIGIAALGAGAAAVYAAWKENTEKSKQEVSDMYDDMVQSGLDYVSQEMVTQRIKDIVNGADDAVMQLKTVKEISDETGITQAKVIAAAAGDLEARAQVIAALNETLDGLQSKYRAATTSEKTRMGSDISAVAALKDEFEALTKKQSHAVEQAELYRDAIASLDPTDSLSGQSRAFEQLKGSIDAATASVAAMPASKTITIKADTSGLDSAIGAWAGARRPVKIAAEFVTRDGKQVY